jgi:hypothetical protein
MKRSEYPVLMLGTIILLSIGFVMGHYSDKRYRDRWWQTHPQSSPNFTFAERMPRGGMICGNEYGFWSESGDICHAKAAERKPAR